MENELIENDDHKRGCAGRMYSCTCGYDEAVDAELRRLHTRAAAPSWQPISTAPKDGTPIMLFARAKHATAEIILVGWYVQGYGWTESTFTGAIGVIPSMWQPLPAPPGAVADDETPTIAHKAGCGQQTVRNDERMIKSLAHDQVRDELIMALGDVLGLVGIPLRNLTAKDNETVGRASKLAFPKARAVRS